MAITVTKALTSFQDVVLGKVDKVLYFKAGLDADALKTAMTADMALPILDESLTFDMGAAEVTRVKLIDQTNWVSYAKKGDPDIQFQIPSFSDDIANTFGNKKGNAAPNATDKMSYQGYSDAPKKVTGALIFVGDDEKVQVVLPNVEIYSAAVLGDGDNPSYFNCVVTPLADTAGAVYYIGKSTAE